MGFLIRSVFWLGVVYSAMPMDWGDVATAVPAASGAACAGAANLVANAISDAPGATSGEARLLCATAQTGLASAIPAAPALLAASKPARAKAPQSADTLTAGDRHAPWRGAQSRTAG